MQQAGVIDLTPCGKLELRGRDAARLLDRLTANDLPGVGRTVTTHLLTERGRVYAELLITRLEDDSFFCITGAGSELHDLRYNSKLYEFVTIQTLVFWTPGATNVVLFAVFFLVVLGLSLGPDKQKFLAFALAL